MRQLLVALMVSLGSSSILGQMGKGAAEGLAKVLEGIRGELKAGEYYVLGAPEEDGSRQFLGCLSCGDVEAESVHNRVGRYGSAVSRVSIRNKVGRYGSAVSPYSACNEVANKPPIVIDRDGRAYGELTVNAIRPRRIRDEKILKWLSGLCSEE